MTIGQNSWWDLNLWWIPYTYPQLRSI
jgi:hypothetical protein